MSFQDFVGVGRLERWAVLNLREAHPCQGGGRERKESEWKGREMRGQLIRHRVVVSIRDSKLLALFNPKLEARTLNEELLHYLLIKKKIVLMYDNRTAPCTPKPHFRASHLSSNVCNIISLREYVPIYLRGCQSRKPHHLRRCLGQVQSMKRIFCSL